MSEAMLKYQCPACGGALEFSAPKQLLVCPSCDSEYPQDMIQAEQGADQQAQQPAGRIDWNIEGYVRDKAEMGEQSGFSCTSCGAEVVSDGDTVATECMYCGNPVVMTDNISGMLTPDVVIPFKIDKKRAEEMLREFYGGKPLLPDSFTKGNRISKVSGVYVPFWLFSCMGSGTVNFTATKVRKWSDSNYNYTKTETYEVFRAGHIGFDNIPVDASTKMDDHYMDGLEPFDYKDFAQFSPMYMAGYFADKFDVGVNESSQRAGDRVESSVEQAFRDTVKGYTTVNKKTSFVKMNGEDIKYALFPVWMLNTKYEGKMYQFAINAQTGQVSGELPIDRAKLLKWRLGITLASAIPIAAIVLLFM